MSSATSNATSSATSNGSVTAESVETARKPVPGTGHHGQTFLVGDEIYIRGIEVEDAPFGMSWRRSLFPQSANRVETWIKEDMTNDRDTTWYAIVRKSDDRIVGSARVSGAQDLAVHLGLHVDPLYGDRGLAWKAETLIFLVPWLVDERHRTMLFTFQAADEPSVIDAAHGIGMRQTGRYRERLDRDGQRVDELVLQYLNPHWIANIGDPDDVALERTGTGQPRPVPPKVTLDGDHPRNAMMVGQRVYLRPPDRKDADEEALWSRREPETFFDIGRHLWSSVGGAHWREEGQKPNLPNWIGFAVCLRENDELIGSVDLFGIDYQNRFAETGSYFHRSRYRGGGYGSEAKQLLLEYAFERLGLHTIQSWVYFQNTRSAAALRKQGYREAGRINWLYSNNGRLDNFVIFDLLAEEWRAMPREAWDGPAS